MQPFCACLRLNNKETQTQKEGLKMVYIRRRTLEIVTSLMITASLLVLSILSYGYYLHH
jgi:hypothetical protein